MLDNQTEIAHSTPLLTYKFLQTEQIHVMTFHKPSRQAYDEFISVMDQIYKTLNDDSKMRIIVDYRESGIPPMQYVVSKGVEWAKSLSVHPQAKMALLTKADFIVSLLARLVQVFEFSHLSTRIYENETAYQDALDWMQD